MKFWLLLVIILFFLDVSFCFFCCFLLFLAHTSTSSIPGFQDLFFVSRLKIENHGKKDTLFFFCIWISIMWHSKILDLSKPSGNIVVILKTRSQIQPGSFTFSSSSNQSYRGIHEPESKENIDNVDAEILGTMERDGK